MAEFLFGACVLLVVAILAVSLCMMIRAVWADLSPRFEATPVVADRFTDARFRRVVREAGFPLCLDGDECGEKRCGCWMMTGPEAVASLLSASESVAEWRHGEMVRLRGLALALADRIHAAHEVLARLAERRAVVLTERDSCPLG